jgi:peptide/nickel transport system ATP-binding protein
VSDIALTIRDLCVSFETDQGQLNVLDHINLELRKGRTHGLVGESGCGKSVTSMSIMRLLPQPYGRISSGSIFYKDLDLASCPPSNLRRIRGNKIAMIFQEPMTALNPVKTIGSQLFEIYSLHQPELSNKQQITEAIKVLDRVGIPETEQRLMEYPHQLSGGMRQRVMIAMALACKPEILIADEPTTALDVTIQAQILDLIKELQTEQDMAVLFITHDLGVIAEICEDVSVMYAGRVVEHGPVNEIFAQPAHPYTKGLLESVPHLNTKKHSRLATIEGQVPSLLDMPEGCRFFNRCPQSSEDCKTLSHQLENINDQHFVGCCNWKA